MSVVLGHAKDGFTNDFGLLLVHWACTLVLFVGLFKTLTDSKSMCLFPSDPGDHTNCVLPPQVASLCLLL